MSAPAVGQQVVACTTQRIGQDSTAPAVVTVVLTDASLMAGSPPHLVSLEITMPDGSKVARGLSPLFATKALALANGNPLASWTA